MSAMIVPKGPPARIVNGKSPAEQDHEPRLCWRELVQLAADGLLPNEHRLEHLLDRIERRP